MIARTRNCPCCKAVVSSAIHPDDFTCPNGKARRHASGGTISGKLSITGNLAITGPKGPHGLPGGPAAGTVIINVTNAFDPNLVARLIDRQRHQLLAQR